MEAFQLLFGMRPSVAARIEELRHLVAAGPDVDARDEHGQTALMLAAADGSRLVVQWLVDCGAGLDHTGKYNLSALMLAMVNGRVDVVRTLVSAGANLGLRGTGAPGFAGKTALDLAVARNEAEIIDILRFGRGDESRMTSNLHFATAGSWAPLRRC